MYNRYIPQPDGTFRRSRISDPPSARPVSPPREEKPAPPPAGIAAPPVRRPCPPPRSVPSRAGRQDPPTGVGTFLRQLLPRDFDTEDLLIVLLLLLMSGDCREDQNTALLTLALYLFM